MDSPYQQLLDRRSEQVLYEQSWALAKRYFPRWVASYPPDWTPQFNARDIPDPGLVNLRLFAKLSHYLTLQLNRTPTNELLSFYEYFGFQQQLACPALVPLRFEMIESAHSVSLQRGIQLTTTDDPQLTYELVHQTDILPIRLEDVIFTNPENDSYTRYSHPQINETSENKHFQHLLYLGDTKLFDFTTPTNQIRILFYGTNLDKIWFDQHNWILYPQGKRLTAHISGDYSQLEATLTLEDAAETIDTPLPEKLSTQAPNQSWISITPNPTQRVIQNERHILPEINEIEAQLLEKTGVLPDHSAFNDSPIDIKKGAYPFGEIPQIHDTFYLSSYAFAMEGSTIILKLIVTPLKLYNISAQLTWEYWDGLDWDELSVDDTTNSFTQDGTISFSIKNSIPTSEINGQEGSWIRCRITSGAYGYPGQTVVTQSAAQIFSRIPDSIICAGCSDCNANKTRSELIDWFDANNINFGFEYVEPQYWPPYIESLLISYEYSKAPSSAVAYNNDQQWTDLRIHHMPYIPSEYTPALNLGFNRTSVEELSGKQFSILLHFIKNHTDQIVQPSFSYWNGTSWHRLPVERISQAMVGAALIKGIIPDDMVPTELQGSDTLFWIRITTAEPINPSKVIESIYTNVAIAISLSTYQDQLLGSGTGQADFTTNCTNTPVINLKLDIFEQQKNNETSTIDDKATGIIYSNEPQIDPLLLKGEPAETILETGKVEDTGAWIRWQQVDNFVFAGPRDRVYILDSGDGTLYFGNGVNGMIPPIGTNNIRATHYQTPLHAIDANIQANQQFQLQTSIPEIQKITNPMTASGGVDQQSRSDLLTKAPALLKSRQRAVSTSDYSALAYSASPRVAKATVIPQRQGTGITIQILTDQEDYQYTPSNDLIQKVEAYIKARALSSTKNLIQVEGPLFQPIDLKLTRSTNTLTNIPISLETQLSIHLSKYFNPFNGGDQQQGWKPGVQVSLQPLIMTLKNVSELDSIDFDTISSSLEIKLKAGHLPIIGKVQIL